VEGTDEVGANSLVKGVHGRAEEVGEFGEGLADGANLRAGEVAVFPCEVRVRLAWRVCELFHEQMRCGEMVDGVVEKMDGHQSVRRGLGGSCLHHRPLRGKSHSGLRRLNACDKQDATSSNLSKKITSPLEPASQTFALSSFDTIQ